MPAKPGHGPAREEFRLIPPREGEGKGTETGPAWTPATLDRIDCRTMKLEPRRCHMAKNFNAWPEGWPKTLNYP